MIDDEEYSCQDFIYKMRESEVTSQKKFTSNYGEERDNCYDEGEISKGLDLGEEEDEVIQHKKDIEEDEDIEYNIKKISKANDFSPRHTDSLKKRQGKVDQPFLDGSNKEQ